MFDLYGLDYWTHIDEDYAEATFYVPFTTFLGPEALDRLDEDVEVFKALVDYLATYGVELGDPGWDEYDWDRVPLEIYTAEASAEALHAAAMPLIRALQDPSGTFDYDVMTITDR